MPQYPQNTTYKNAVTGKFEFGSTDGAGTALVTGYGSSSALNKTTTGVIKTGPGRLSKIIVLAGGTGTSLVLNDAATVGAAAAANALYNSAVAAAAGTIIVLDIPFTNGLVISAVPGGSPQFVLVYS